MENRQFSTPKRTLSVILALLVIIAGIPVVNGVANGSLSAPRGALAQSEKSYIYFNQPSSDEDLTPYIKTWQSTPGDTYSKMTKKQGSNIYYYDVGSLSGTLNYNIYYKQNVIYFYDYYEDEANSFEETVWSGGNGDLQIDFYKENSTTPVSKPMTLYNSDSHLYACYYEPDTYTSFRVRAGVKSGNIISLNYTRAYYKPTTTGAEIVLDSSKGTSTTTNYEPLLNNNCFINTSKTQALVKLDGTSKSYVETNVSPLSIDSLSFINASTNTEATFLYEGGTYKLNASVTGGISELTNSVSYSLCAQSGNTWTPSKSDEYSCTVNVTNGIDEVSYVYSGIKVSGVVQYPDVQFLIDSDDTDTKTVYVPYGEEKTLRIYAKTIGKLLYKGQEITDYRYIFSIDNNHTDNGNSGFFDYKVEGNESLRGQKKCSVMLSFYADGQEIISSALNTVTINFYVPELSVQNSSHYLNRTTDIEIKTSDVSEVYYKIYNGSELPDGELDIDSYTKADISNGKFSVRIDALDNKDKVVHAIGYYNGKFYYVEKVLNYLIDSVDPEVQSARFDAVGVSNLSFFSFGVFANGKTDLTVTATDNKSGIDSVLLYRDAKGVGGNAVELIDCETKTESIDARSVKTVFTLNVPFEENIYIEVTDKAGNKTLWAVTEIENGTELMEIENYIVIESSLPNIVINTQNRPEYSSNGNTFYDKGIVNITLSDAESGLASYVVKLNGNIVAQESNISKNNNGIVSTRTFAVSTSDAPKSADGKYEIFVEVIDNAGNMSRNNTSSMYLDITPPEIVGYEITALGNSSLNSNENIFPFGILYNGDIELKITARDSANTAGIKEITLSESEHIKKVGEATQTLVNNDAIYTVTYRISLPYCGTLVADVVDNAGNKLNYIVPIGAPITILHEGKIVDTYTYDEGVDYSDFVIDLSSNCRARYTFKPDSEPVYVDGIKKWYNDDVGVTVIAAEYANKGSVGIRETYVTLNGSEIKDTPQKEVINSVISSVTYKINTSMASNGEKDGKYVINGTVIDNAGNESVSTSTLYVDSTAPQISGFKFTPKNSVNGETANLVETNYYGYYFKADTTVTVTANELTSDSDKASGVKTIYYEMVPVNGSKKTGHADGNEIKFTVPADFKGQIYAYAVDNTGNKSKTVHPEGLIVESEQLHKQSSSLGLSMDQTSHKDISGNKLYSKDVNVKVTVADSYSGIKSVKYTVESPYDTGKNVSSTVTANDGVLSDKSWTVTKTDTNLVTEITKTIKVTNNSNDIVLKVTLTDNAGNTSTKSVKFSIDKTAPSIDLNLSGSGTYSNSSRTLTISIKERNLTLNNINNYIDKMISSSNGGKVPQISLKLNKNSNDPDSNTFIGTAVFSSDGTYKYGIKVSDMAGNSSSKSGKNTFTIDKSAPQISFSSVKRYNNSAVTLTVTVKEANFNEAAALAAMSITAYNGSAPSFGAWSSSGNTHTASATFRNDGDYSVSMNYTDRAGNNAKASVDRFTVDVNAPKIKVTGLVNNKAYTKDIITFSVEVTDMNLDKTDIKLTGLCRNDGEYVNDVPCDTKTQITNGMRYTWSNIKSGSDGIYTLTCTATDKAGNKTTALREKDGANDDNSKLVFSVNRDGSTYEIESETNKIIGSWVSSAKEITFSEINADPINLDSIVIKITNKSTQEEYILKRDSDYTVKLVNEDGKWYKYIYTINSENFTEDGYYDIEVTSVDSTNKTTSSKNNAFGQKLIAYGIDTNAANIDISGINNGPYDSITRDAIITVTDISLTNVIVKLNGKVVEEWTAENAGETYNGTVTINESGSLQKVTVEAVDAAGNTNSKEQEVFVSSNGFSIFMYRAGGFISNNAIWLILVIILIAAAITAVIISKKRKDKNNTPAVNKSKK